MSFATIPEILADIRAGRMVVIVDDEDRENEGDLIMAAEMTRPEDINFMAREGRGLICLSMTRARCRQLGLKPMVDTNTSAHHTNFTVSIEAAEGVTTGISAYDRAHTIRTAVRPDARPDHIVQPGHIFPLTAQPGGVLARAGHTEAACDLAALAGLEPAGVLVEILSEDGTMARRPELETFALKHGLKIGTIADLIRYRLETEKTVERVHEGDVDTEFGRFRLIAYRDVLARELHFALVRGAIADGAPVLIARARAQHPVRRAAPEARRSRPDRHRGAAPCRRGGSRRGRRAGWRGCAGHHARPPARRARQRAAGDAQWRTLGLGAQILADLGVHRLRVLGTPRKLVGLAGSAWKSSATRSGVGAEG